MDYCTCSVRHSTGVQKCANTSYWFSTQYYPAVLHFQVPTKVARNVETQRVTWTIRLTFYVSNVIDDSYLGYPDEDPLVRHSSP